MESQIDRAMRRTSRYWYEDGLAEMAMGCIFAALGLVFFLQRALPPGPLQALCGMLGPLAAVVGVGLLGSRVLKVAKARITYPRTGYVAYRRMTASHRLQKAAMGGAIGALVATIAALPSLKVWVPAISGLIMGSVWVYLGHRLDLPRLYMLAAAAAVLGILVSLGGFDDLTAGALYFAGLGLAIVVSGAVTLGVYLRSTEPLAEEEGCGQ